MYIDYSVYCRENLHEEDRKKLDKFCDIMEDIVKRAEFQYYDMFERPIILDDIRKEIAKEVFEFVKESIGETLTDSMVAVIDSYDEKLKSVNKYTTYHYDDEANTFYKYEEEE